MTPVYTDAQIEKYSQECATNPDLYPDTDWQKEVLKGFGHDAKPFRIGISGSSGKLRFHYHTGVSETGWYYKIIFIRTVCLRNNADVKFSDKVSMKLDLQLINRNRTEPGRGMENVFSQMNRIPQHS